MLSQEVIEFARNLVRHVRDAAIADADITMRSPGPTGKRWREAAEKYTPAEFAAMVIPEVVDEAVFFLLRAIDEGEIQLLVRASNGRVVDLATDGSGELAGWYIGAHGWREAYSTQRHFPRS